MRDGLVLDNVESKKEKASIRPVVMSLGKDDMSIWNINRGLENI